MRRKSLTEITTILKIAYPSVPTPKEGSKVMHQVHPSTVPSTTPRRSGRKGIAKSSVQTVDVEICRRLNPDLLMASLEEAEKGPKYSLSELDQILETK